MLLYSFLKEFHAKLTVYLTQKEKKKTFDMDRIVNPHEYKLRKKTKKYMSMTST